MCRFLQPERYNALAPFELIILPHDLVEFCLFQKVHIAFLNWCSTCSLGPTSLEKQTKNVHSLKAKRKRKRKTEQEKLPSSFIDHSLEHGYGFIEHSQLVFHCSLSAVVFYWCSTETVMDHDIPAAASNAGGAFCSANWIVYSFVFCFMSVAKTFTICSAQGILWTLHQQALQTVQAFWKRSHRITTQGSTAFLEVFSN